MAAIAMAMGETTLLPPWLAGWAPTLILASVVGSLMIYQEPVRRSPSRRRAVPHGR